MRTASKPNHFNGPNDDGKECVIPTIGNKTGFTILRGGLNPNYDAVSVEHIRHQLEKAGVSQNMIIDCAHGNCLVDGVKTPSQQRIAALDVIDQIARGTSPTIKGLMFEADLSEGSIKIQPGTKVQHPLRISVTDPCMSMDQYIALLEELHSML